MTIPRGSLVKAHVELDEESVSEDPPIVDASERNLACAGFQAVVEESIAIRMWLRDGRKKND